LPGAKNEFCYNDNSWQMAWRELPAAAQVKVLIMRMLPCLFVSLAVFTLSLVGQADDFMFIHHSVGQNWLDHSLKAALEAKSYVDQVNGISYGNELPPDVGRPASLGSVPGDSTDLNTWVLWFNDYLGQVKVYPERRVNAIVMYKSCFPNSDITSDGAEPGNPLGDLTLANLKAIYRHPNGSGHTYDVDGHMYRPLEDVFAANPSTLFIAVTSPPLNYSSTDDAAAHRARLFNNWLKGEWLTAYKTAHPGLNNVAVFDLFNELANPDSGAYSNRLKSAYGGETDDSHPNDAANAHLTAVFATNAGSFLDSAWAAACARTDTTAPTGSIWINNNRSVTNNPNAILALDWHDGAGSGVARMRFSNDGANWSAWESLAAVRAYALSGADGYKTVRVQYLDRANNRSAVFSDYIRLDTVPPTGGIVIDGGAQSTTSRNVTLDLSWADTGSGVVRMRFSDNGSNWSAWEPQRTPRYYTLPAGPGYHTVRVQYLDAGNNYSPVYSDYIKLVSPAP